MSLIHEWLTYYQDDPHALRKLAEAVQGDLDRVYDELDKKADKPDDPDRPQWEDTTATPGYVSVDMTVHYIAVYKERLIAAVEAKIGKNESVGLLDTEIIKLIQETT